MEKAVILIKGIMKFLDEFTPVLEDSTVDFYTSNMWDKNLKHDFACELLQLTDAKLAKLPSGRIFVENKREFLDGEFPLLREFVNKILANRLDTASALDANCCVTATCVKDSFLGHVGHDAGNGEVRDASTSRSSAWEHPADWLSAAQLESRENSELTKRIMGKKKSHEVAQMAQKCAQLLSATCISQVVDIGSGKGYLGQFLSMQYGINVISVDSSETNTNGALKRSNRLSKQWKGIVKNAIQSSKGKTSDDEFDRNKDCRREGETIRDSDENTDGTDRFQSDSPESDSMTHAAGANELTSRTLSLSQEEKQVQHESARNIDSGLSQERTWHEGDKTSMPRTGINLEKPEEGGKKPATCMSVTGYVDEETDLGDFLQCDENAKHFDMTQPFMMVGLHTCGDLAPSMLRIFQSNPSMHCLCNVGCCYHLITEEFARADEWDQEHPGVKMGSSFGFPMSSYLREKKVALGRTARMTACLAAARVASEATVDVRGLFYRAVLQVICRDHFTIPTRKQIIGKLAPKCKSFLEYVRKALRKLKMDDTKLSDDEIRAYEVRYSPCYRHLAAYNQIKAALAPSIEALILLDRLLYLKEQPNIRMASIVRLFDPVTSPRCYAIMAVKVPR